MLHLYRDLAVFSTLFTPNGQNRNRVHWNICAGVLRHTPSFEVVWTEQSHDLFRNKITRHCRGYFFMFLNIFILEKNKLICKRVEITCICNLLISFFFSFSWPSVPMTFSSFKHHSVGLITCFTLG